jgi:oxygen-independent coproporphyrinogen-3 oxidase
MGGIYVHIPFCRQACRYCNFHFSTTHTLMNAVVEGIVREAELRRTGWATWCARAATPPPGRPDAAGDRPSAERPASLYLGGGTPSLLPPAALERLLAGLMRYAPLPGAEITLEANPDDVTPERVAAWRAAGINRLSLGVQSFRDADLAWMGRAHRAEDARRALERLAAAGFMDLSADLIYGLPELDDDAWRANIDELVARGLPHVSAYALTLEPRTALAHAVAVGRETAPDPARAERQFRILAEALDRAGYVAYEISNWCLPGHAAVHNSAYWGERPYLGLGPAAHGFDGHAERQWNVAHNPRYVEAVAAAHAAGDATLLPLERETLTAAERLNERLMTGLRTTWGVPRHGVEAFGRTALAAVERAAARWVASGHLGADAEGWWLTPSGRFLADGIAADLFVDEDQAPGAVPVIAERPRRALWGGRPFAEG